VRTLAHDLGGMLGPGAALVALRRTRSEPFGVDHAVGLEDLDRLTPGEVLERGGIPLDEALRVLPELVLDEPAALEVGLGGRPRVGRGSLPVGAGPRSVVLRGPDGRALALGELAPGESDDEAVACPHVVFPWAVRARRRPRDASVPWEALSEPGR
jgi:tRNA pseudouridine55 synthase